MLGVRTGRLAAVPVSAYSKSMLETIRIVFGNADKKLNARQKLRIARSLKKIQGRLPEGADQGAAAGPAEVPRGSEQAEELILQSGSE